jgi:quercetin dioxygenase-like cupin family protein
MIETLAWDRLPETVVHDAIRRRIFTTDTLMVVRYDFPPGAVFPRHAHPEPQVTLILSGALAFHYDDRVTAHCPGDIVSIAGGVPHEGRAGDGGAVILCLFAPPRREPAANDRSRPERGA